MTRKPKTKRREIGRLWIIYSDYIWADVNPESIAYGFYDKKKEATEAKKEYQRRGVKEKGKVVPVTITIEE